MEKMKRLTSGTPITTFALALKDEFRKRQEKEVNERKPEKWKFDETVEQKRLEMMKSKAVEEFMKPLWENSNWKKTNAENALKILKKLQNVQSDTE